MHARHTVWVLVQVELQGVSLVVLSFFRDLEAATELANTVAAAGGIMGAAVCCAENGGDPNDDWTTCDRDRDMLLDRLLTWGIIAPGMAMHAGCLIVRCCFSAATCVPPLPSAHTLAMQIWPSEAMLLHASTEAYCEQPYWQSRVWSIVKPADEHLGSGMLCSTH